jgi:hypothetical protein
VIVAETKLVSQDVRLLVHLMFVFNVGVIFAVDVQ